MSAIDKVLNSLPYTNFLSGPNQKDINKKFETFADASITKEEKVQRLSVVNRFDNEMASSTHAGMWINSLSELIFSSDSNDKARRIEGYRQMSGFPEVNDCLREICDEFIVKDENGKILQFSLRGTHNEEIKEAIKDEFYKFLEIFNLELNGWDYMRQFLVEGEIFFENIVSIQKPELGIIGLTRIGPDRIDPFYYDIDNELISLYVLRKKMLDQGRARFYASAASNALDKKNEILFLNEKQITYVHSGHWDDSGKKKYRKPHIENGSRPYRQLALIEDATIIYMLVRAPERLVFNIDTGHLPPGQAESYVKKQMGEFWNRKGVGRDGRVENVYDPMTLLENYYFAKPRGSDGSSVTSIGGGNASPDNMEILTLFINRLYKAMGVPLQRLNAETAFSDGMDVTREELRFAKFIMRLQQRFAMAIKSTFITHLKLKGRNITEQAASLNISTVPEGKQWFDRTDWNNYDILCNQVKAKVDEKINLIKEDISRNKEIIKTAQNEILNMESLVMEESTKHDRRKVLTELMDSSLSQIKSYQMDIKTIREEGETLWSQYDLREEDIDLEFNKPSQFFALKEQQMWQLKFESYQSLAQDDLISSTLAQKTHLGWSDTDIMANREALRKEAAFRWELANIETEGPDFREKMAGDAAMGGGDLGGMGGDLGGDFGGGMGPDSDTSLPDFGAAPTDAEIMGVSDPDQGEVPPEELPPPPQ
jgi:hypothetical protein